MRQFLFIIKVFFDIGLNKLIKVFKKPHVVFDNAILTDGTLDDSGWKRSRTLEINNNIYVIYERVLNKTKEVRWFLQKNNELDVVFKKDVEALLSVKSNKKNYANINKEI
jgi:hypothetical protein